MKLVGLTGGMGSGKTTVAEMFKDLGIPVYNSDLEARRLMNEDEGLKNDIISLFGEQAYSDGQLNRPFIADKVFKNKKLLQALNQRVHPAVRHDFQAWASRQSTPYVLQEAAILFENGSSEAFDFMILVTAPKKLRISRIKQRDRISEEAISERIQHQWPEKKKKALADFTILNTDIDKTREQVRIIHEQLVGNRHAQQF